MQKQTNKQNIIATIFYLFIFHREHHVFSDVQWSEESSSEEKQMDKQKEIKVWAIARVPVLVLMKLSK